MFNRAQLGGGASYNTWNEVANPSDLMDNFPNSMVSLPYLAWYEVSIRET